MRSIRQRIPTHFIMSYLDVDLALEWGGAAAEKLMITGPRLEPKYFMWCWENVGAYRITSFDRRRKRNIQWCIEFKSVADATAFKLRWL